MKLLILCFGVLCACGSPQVVHADQRQSSSMDSLFLSHVRAIRAEMFDSIRPDSLFIHVNYMVHLTSIEPSGVKNVMGYNAVTEANLLNWMDWYLAHRPELARATSARAQ